MRGMDPLDRGGRRWWRPPRSAAPVVHPSSIASSWVVQQNNDEVARMQAENRRLLQEVQALGQLLRMDQDAGTESSAVRLAKLEQVSARLDQLLQQHGGQRPVHARPVRPRRPAGHALGHSDPRRVQAAGRRRRRPRPCPRRAAPSSKRPSWTATGATRPWPAPGSRSSWRVIRAPKRPTTLSTGWAIWTTATDCTPRPWPASAS